MSRLERLPEQPFREASNRGFDLLLVGGVGLLAVVALLGRHPVLEAAVVAYLLAIPTYVAYRVRAWNEELARVEPPDGREESTVAGLQDGQGDGEDGADETGEGADGADETGERADGADDGDDEESG